MVSHDISPLPWDDKTCASVKEGEPCEIFMSGKVPRDLRLVSEENYQYAKQCVNEHERLKEINAALLEALKILTTRIQGRVPATPGMEESPIWQAIFQANEAIQKAEGL